METTIPGTSTTPRVFEIVHPCKLCGKPMVTKLPPEAAQWGDDTYKAIVGLVPGVVHNECADRSEAEDRAREIVARNQARMQLWSKMCPDIFLPQTFEPKRMPSKAWQEVMNWRYGPEGLLVHGHTGLGKSRAVWLMLHQQFQDGRRIVAMSHIQFANEARTIVMGDPREMRKWMTTMCRCDILFLDDLGKSRMAFRDGSGSHAEEALFEICDERFSRKLPCLFTTQDVGNSLVDRMSPDRGPAFVRRLREFCHPIAF